MPAHWQEPAGRVVIESLAAGCAVIASDRGGIGEYATGRAYLIHRTKPTDIATALHRLLRNSKVRHDLQQKAWTDYPFTIANMVSRLDAARDAILR